MAVVAVGVGGGIAAYKSLELVRLLWERKVAILSAALLCAPPRQATEQRGDK